MHIDASSALELSGFEYWAADRGVTVSRKSRASAIFTKKVFIKRSQGSGVTLGEAVESGCVFKCVRVVNGVKIWMRNVYFAICYCIVSLVLR